MINCLLGLCVRLENHFPRELELLLRGHLQPERRGDDALSKTSCGGGCGGGCGGWQCGGEAMAVRVAVWVRVVVWIAVWGSGGGRSGADGG